MNVTIIGNGFDLAHGLKTDYNSFIEWLIENELKNAGVAGGLLYNRRVDNQNIRINLSGVNSFTSNLFFVELISNQLKNNWCDIEDLYYQILQSTKDPLKLNKEFLIIKDKLEQYLTSLNHNITPIDKFTDYFSKLGYSNDLNIIINFNYTNTVHELYGNHLGLTEIINIHGQLKDIKNPIIFGYAANQGEIQKLLSKNNDDYLKNIKSLLYKRNDFDKDCFKIIEKSTYAYNLDVIGHSCSLSDKNILNSLFTHDRLQSFVIHHHENWENYHRSVISIKRIMERHNNFEKINSYKNSPIIPQYNDI